jgi:hypothetical protein
MGRKYLNTDIQKTLALSERLKITVLEEIQWGITLRTLLKLPRTSTNTVLINRLISQSTR